jgi:hypothetical protein
MREEAVGFDQGGNVYCIAFWRNCNLRQNRRDKTGSPIRTGLGIAGFVCGRKILPGRTRVKTMIVVHGAGEKVYSV